MLTTEQARKIGSQACIDKIGRAFCEEHADNATMAFCENDNVVNCFVGVSDEPAKDFDISKVDRLVLTSQRKWPYSAKCNVYKTDGKIEFLEVCSK